MGTSAAAVGTIYVRTDGSDTACNGTADADASAAPDCAVQTVAKGLALAGPGVTVQVAAGNYAEAVTITQSVVLKGAQAGVDARTRSGSESTINSVTISNASDVTVDGFSFAGTGDQISVTSPTVLSGLVIQNNIFSGYGTVALTTYDAGNILIQQNLFTGPATSGESIQIRASAVQGGCNGSQVLANTFSSATNNGAADVNLSCTGSNSSSVTVANNTTSGDSGGSSFVALSGVTDSISVTDNSGTTDGSSIFFFGAVSGSAVVSGNTFAGSTGSAVTIHGNDYTSDPANTGTFTITGNRFAGNAYYGVSVAAPSLGAGAVVDVHFNELVGNGLAGVNNNSTVATVDATDNWWGCDSGPNTDGCDATAGAGSVISDPWLTLTVAADPATIAPSGNPGDTSTITASLTTDSNGNDTSSAGHVIDGTAVAFSTTDGTLSSNSQPTVNGAASVTLTASALPSTATVTATVDNQADSTDVSWAAPTTQSGAAVLAANRNNPRLRLNADSRRGDNVHGTLTFMDQNIVFSSREIDAVVASGDQATVYGSGMVHDSSGTEEVTFRADVTQTANGGTFELRLSNGYDSGVVDIELANVSDGTHPDNRR